MISSKKFSNIVCSLVLVALAFFIATGIHIFLNKSKSKGIVVNANLELDFKNFTNSKLANVMIREKIYRAIILEADSFVMTRVQNQQFIFKLIRKLIYSIKH